MQFLAQNFRFLRRLLVLRDEQPKYSPPSCEENLHRGYFVEAVQVERDRNKFAHTGRAPSLIDQRFAPISSQRATQLDLLLFR